jgi:hypothetical protein
VNKAVLLGELGRFGEQIITCEQVIDRFGYVTKPGFSEQFADARSLRRRSWGDASERDLVGRPCGR